MNVNNKTLRVLGIVGAVLLSIPLVIMLVIAPLFSATASLVTPQTMIRVVRDMDYTAMLAEQDALESLTDTEHLPSEMMEAMMTSDFIEDVLTVYTEELITVLRGESPTDALSRESLLTITQEHMDELLQLTRTYMPEGEEMTEQEMRTHIQQVMEELGEALATTLPSQEAVQAMTVEGASFNPVTVLVDRSLPVTMYIITAVLAALVFACLLHRFRGLLCLGIDALVALIPLLAVFSLLQEGGYLYNELVSGDSAAVIGSLVGMLTQNLLIAIAIIAVAGLGLIAGYTVYISRQKRRAPEQAGQEHLA